MHGISTHPIAILAAAAKFISLAAETAASLEHIRRNRTGKLIESVADNSNTQCVQSSTDAKVVLLSRG